MITEAEKQRVYIAALLIAFRVAEHGGTAVMELPIDDSGELAPVWIDQAGAITALRAIIGEATCLALDGGLLSPNDLSPLGELVAAARPSAASLH